MKREIQQVLSHFNVLMSFSVGFSSTSIIQPKLLVDFTIIHKEKKKRVLGEGVFGPIKFLLF